MPNLVPTIGIPGMPVIRVVTVHTLIVSYLKTSLKNFLSLSSTNCAVDSDLFISSNTERTDSVPGLGENWCLPGQLLQHFRGTGESVTALPHTDVQAELTDLEVPHGVFHLGFGNHS